MKKLAFISIFLLLIGCNKQAQNCYRTDNANFNVEVLFEIDGVRVYRFYDGGRAHYFCSRGKTMSHHLECHGKHSYWQPEDIETLEKK